MMMEVYYITGMQYAKAITNVYVYLVATPSHSSAMVPPNHSFINNYVET